VEIFQNFVLVPSITYQPSGYSSELGGRDRVCGSPVPYS